jgi:hypothetical protein
MAIFIGNYYSKFYRRLGTALDFFHHSGNFIIQNRNNKYSVRRHPVVDFLI